MDVFTIPASKSLTLTDKIPDGNIQDYKIIVGCDDEFEYHSLKGIVISNIWNNSIASFGSVLAKKQQIVPLITITCEYNDSDSMPIKNNKSHCNHNFHLSVQIGDSCNSIIPQVPPNPSLIEVIATGTIEQHSIFVVMIELVITRSTGNIDKYYVSDEYINSTDEPLNINKTYSIPVVPALNTGDLVTSANIYGAYRE